MKQLGSNFFIIMGIISCAGWFGWWKKSWQAGLFVWSLLWFIITVLDTILPLFLVKP